MLEFIAGASGQWTSSSLSTAVSKVSLLGGILGIDVEANNSFTCSVSSSAGNLAKNGMGTLTLMGCGALTVNEGTVIAGSGVLSSTVTVNGGVLDLGGSSTNQYPTTVSITGGTIQNGRINGGPYCASGGTISAALKGSSGLTVTGGVVTLSGANTYSGGTVVESGTLMTTAATSLPGYNTAGTVVVGPGAVLGAYAGGTGQWTASGIGTLLSDANFQKGSAFLVSVDANVSVSLSTPSNPNFGLIKSGDGNLILSYAAHGGGTTINAGTLVMGNSSGLPYGGDVTINGAVLDLARYSETVGTLALNGGTIRSGSLTSNVLYYVTGGVADANLYGTAPLFVTGGFVTLTGGNAYSGGTIVMGGTLLATTPGSLPSYGTGGGR